MGVYIPTRVLLATIMSAILIFFQAYAAEPLPSRMHAVFLENRTPIFDPELETEAPVVVETENSEEVVVAEIPETPTEAVATTPAVETPQPSTPTTVPVLDRNLVREDMDIRDLVYQGKITPSVYYKPILADKDFPCKEEDKKPLRGDMGQDLVNVCPAVFDRCVMEGSCSIEIDGKLKAFNYLGMSRDKAFPRFTEFNTKRCPYGLGVRNSCLDPFYSVAADLEFHKPGDVIYIPMVVGMLLPSGDIHNGFFIVRDEGHAIQGTHRFDFFTGNLTWIDPTNPFNTRGLNDTKRSFDYYVLQNKYGSAEKFRRDRNFPRLRRDILPPPSHY